MNNILCDPLAEEDYICQCVSHNTFYNVKIVNFAPLKSCHSVRPAGVGEYVSE